MTKKDYEAIAGVLRMRRSMWSGVAKIAVDSIAEGLTTIMERDNPRFDRERFLAACRGENATDSRGRKVSYSTR